MCSHVLTAALSGSNLKKKKSISGLILIDVKDDFNICRNYTTRGTKGQHHL